MPVLVHAFLFVLRMRRSIVIRLSAMDMYILIREKAAVWSISGNRKRGFRLMYRIRQSGKSLPYVRMWKAM